MNTDSRQIPALTSLRFFAAAVVVIYHLGAWNLVDLSGWPKFQLPNGVSFFYVLSGFILHWTYRNRRDVKFGTFMAMRVARIWPLHAVICIVLLLTGFQDRSGRDLLSFLKVMLLVQSWDTNPDVHFSWNGPSWSISNEVFFYLWLLPASLLVRRSLIAFIGVVTLLALVYFGSLPEVSDGGVRNALYGVIPVARLPEFLLGVGACEIGVRLAAVPRSTSLRTWTVIETAAIALVLLWNLTVVPITPWFIANFGLGPTTGLYQSGTAPAFALLILVFAYSKGLISRCLSARPLVLLGEISFAIYLVHEPILETMMPSTAAQLTLFCVVVLVTALAAWKYIERPSMDWARRALKKRSVGPSAPIRAQRQP